MSSSELLKLVESGDYGGFETRCLELAEAGDIKPREMIASIEQLRRKGKSECVDAVGQLLYDAVTPDADPCARLDLATALLDASPKNAAFRATTLEAYRGAHADTRGFDTFLKSSGLESGRPARRALRILHICVSSSEGSFVLNRMDGTPAEVTSIDFDEGLFTLKAGARITTIPPGDLASEYEPVEAEDFRVLKLLRPDRITELAHSDPVELVVNMLHSHGEALDVDLLKDDLVPRYLTVKEWTGWWSKTKTKLKRCPKVIIEGRSPMLLRYTDVEITLEQHTWEAVEATDDPAKWTTSVEAYLREKSQRKEAVDDAFVQRIRDHLVAQTTKLRARRPSDALAAALALARLGEKGLPLEDADVTLAASMLESTDDPIKMVGGLVHPTMWSRALSTLGEARPDDGVQLMIELMPRAPEAVLDIINAAAAEGELSAGVQAHVDAALAAPVDHAEIICWLWKGPKITDPLSLPTRRELLGKTLGTLSELGRKDSHSASEIKQFRARMKAALGYRNYALFAQSIEEIEVATAVTVRRQIERLDGLGGNAPLEMMRILREKHPILWAPKHIQPWEDANVLWTTRAGYTRKKAQIDDLVNVKMPANAKAIGAAAEHGDLSENSEYKFALEERDLLRARLAALNADLSKAHIIESDDAPTDHVGVGTRVTLRNLADQSPRVMTFLGAWDADVENGIYNCHAPVGERVMGAKIGEHVRLSVDGEECEFEVTALENGLIDLGVADAANPA